MPQNVTLYTLLISCPGDVKDEVKLIIEAVDEFNDMFSETLGITIQAKHWSKNSYPQSGGKPQTLLNDQIVKKCDAAVAIFWTRFGSPTDEYGSGTEEEIELMLNSNKQVFMYFSDKPLQPSQYDEEGYKKVKAFREKYADKGIYHTYKSDETFKKNFFAHLTQHFMSEKKLSETKVEKMSVLKLQGIDSEFNLQDEFVIQPFVLNDERSIKKYKKEILRLLEQISSIHLTCTLNEQSIKMISSLKPTAITSQEKSVIKNIAIKLKFNLPEDFFCFGNLMYEASMIPKNILPISYRSLYGTDNEKHKFYLMENLKETVFKYNNWERIETKFANSKCVRLAISNIGTAVDEDITISITIPKKALILTREFPQLFNDEKYYMLYQCNMYKLFGIDGTDEYDNYYSSTETNSSIPTSKSNFLEIEPDYTEEYEATMEDIFCYSIYSKENNYVLKFKVDYLKHHTAVAFPSVIMLKDYIDEIPYKITSKNLPDVSKGVLKNSK